MKNFKVTPFFQTLTIRLIFFLSAQSSVYGQDTDGDGRIENVDIDDDGNAQSTKGYLYIN